MSKNPWFKFWPADWQSDEKLRMCSIAARGLWAEMLCLTHKADKYGHLLVNGEAPNNTQLSVLTGVPADQIESLMIELEKMGVFSRTQKGVIYSRRQVRDEKKANHAKNIGKNGGNPNLSKQKGNKAQVNPQDNPEVNPEVKPQKPEAIFKKEKRKKEPPPDGSVPQELRFEGNVVRLNERDWNSWLAESLVTEEQLGKLMCKRDDWLNKLPESDGRREGWFFPTKNWLMNEAENLRKSNMGRS